MYIRQKEVLLDFTNLHNTLLYFKSRVNTQAFIKIVLSMSVRKFLSLTYIEDCLFNEEYYSDTENIVEQVVFIQNAVI